MSGRYLSREGVATLAAMLYPHVNGDQAKRVKASIGLAIQLFEEAEVQCELKLNVEQNEFTLADGTVIRRTPDKQQT